MARDKVICVDIYGKEYEIATNDLRWRPSAYAVVIKDNALLVSKQFDGFDLPGGGINLGELPEEGVVRETKEETGIDVARPVLLGVDSNFFKLPHSDKGEFIQSIMLYYICESAGGELSIEGFDEHEKIYSDMPEWIPLDKLDAIKLSSSVDWRKYVDKVL